MEKLSEEFWNEKYLTDNTGWDLGDVSPPLKAYFDQLQDKSTSILIPGCGRGYEAEYLHKLGFTDIHVVDIASEGLKAFKGRIPNFPEECVHYGDFFEHQGEYDLIVEQTMFCAIDPNLRDKYVNKVHELLKPNGKLIGLLFNFELGGGPPYGGSKEEYTKLFKKKFNSIQIEKCYNSVKPRLGNELFIIIEKDS